MQQPQDSLFEMRPSGPLGEQEALYSDDAVVQEAFEHFRYAGFPYRRLPLHVQMQHVNELARVKTAQLYGTQVAHHVADSYHPHRWHGSAEGMKSPYEAFMDDKLLLRALRLTLEHGGTIGEGVFGKLLIVSGTQACANFRPGFAARMYRDYCEPGATVLDTSTGYGGRLVGAIASLVVDHYIGVDPNVPTYEGNQRLAAELWPHGTCELHCLPAEDVPHELVAGRCDFAFTSPPYFAKEHYADDDTQSWVRYSTGEEWRAGFLEPMLRLQYAALKPGAHAAVNIAPVKLRGKVWPLDVWTREAGMAAGFTYVEDKQFGVAPPRFGASQEDDAAVEPVIVFRKPDDEDYEPW